MKSSFQPTLIWEIGVSQRFLMVLDSETFSIVEIEKGMEDFVFAKIIANCLVLSLTKLLKIDWNILSLLKY